MKKGMMRHINKIMSCFVILSLLIGISTTTVAATTFTLTSNKSAVTPNSSFTVTITVEGAGKFGIVASNATVSSSSIWCDGSCSFDVKAGSEGTAKITVTAQDAYDWKENQITGSRDIEIKVIKASQQQTEGANAESALSVQLAIAEKLKRTNYTDESWQELTNAIEDAKEALKSKNQSEINSAAINLKYAIDSLVEIDHSKLQDAINQANSIIDTQNAYLWKELALVLDANEGKVSSTSQQEVDIATEKIQKVLNDINTELITQDDATHGKDGVSTVWTILFFVSLVINIVIGYMLVNNKKRSFNDDIPVVDYDIDDDNI